MLKYGTTNSTFPIPRSGAFPVGIPYTIYHHAYSSLNIEVPPPRARRQRRRSARRARRVRSRPVETAAAPWPVPARRASRVDATSRPWGWGPSAASAAQALHRHTTWTKHFLVLDQRKQDTTHKQDTCTVPFPPVFHPSTVRTGPLSLTTCSIRPQYPRMLKLCMNTLHTASANPETGIE